MKRIDHEISTEELLGRLHTSMRIRHIILLLAAETLFSLSVCAQGFVNLDFEKAVIVTDPSVPYYPYGVYASYALPGWTAVGFISPTYISYNALSLGATSVTLCGTNSSYSPSALSGLFSIDLYGGSGVGLSAASISQTGLVPANAISIRFIAQGVPQPFGGPLLVSMGGQNTPYVAISTGPNYTVYAGDVSAYAGQVAQLSFSAPNGANNYWEFDGIQFSSAPVPEPSTYAILALCVFIFCLWKKRPNQSPEPTAVGACSSAIAVHVASWRWLSFLR